MRKIIIYLFSILLYQSIIAQTDSIYLKLNSQIEELTATIDSLNNKITELQQKIGDTTDYKKMEIALENISKVNDSLNKVYDSLLIKESNDKEKLNNTKSHYNQLTGQYKIKQDSLALLQRQKDSLRLVNDTLNERKNNYSNQINNFYHNVSNYLQDKINNFYGDTLLQKQTYKTINSAFYFYLSKLNDKKLSELKTKLNEIKDFINLKYQIEQVLNQAYNQTKINTLIDSINRSKFNNENYQTYIQHKKKILQNYCKVNNEIYDKLKWIYDFGISNQTNVFKNKKQECLNASKEYPYLHTQVSQFTSFVSWENFSKNVKKISCKK